MSVLVPVGVKRGAASGHKLFLSTEEDDGSRIVYHRVTLYH